MSRCGSWARMIGPLGDNSSPLWISGEVVDKADPIGDGLPINYHLITAPARDTLSVSTCAHRQPCNAAGRRKIDRCWPKRMSRPRICDKSVIGWREGGPKARSTPAISRFIGVPRPGDHLRPGISEISASNAQPVIRVPSAGGSWRWARCSRCPTARRPGQRHRSAGPRSRQASCPPHLPGARPTMLAYAFAEPPDSAVSVVSRACAIRQPAVERGGPETLWICASWPPRYAHTVGWRLGVGRWSYRRSQRRMTGRAPERRCRQRRSARNAVRPGRRRRSR